MTHITFDIEVPRSYKYEVYKNVVIVECSMKIHMPNPLVKQVVYTRIVHRHPRLKALGTKLNH